MQSARTVSAGRLVVRTAVATVALAVVAATLAASAGADTNEGAAAYRAVPPA